MDSKELMKIMKYVMYGDIENDGPIIRPTERSISIIYHGIIEKDFINKNFSSKTVTLESVVNSLNHFIDYVNKEKGYHYQHIIVDAGIELESDINDISLSPSDIGVNDVSNLSKHSIRILEKHILDKNFIMEIDDYISKFSFKNVVVNNNYVRTSSNDAMHLICMISVILKFAFLILTKGLSKKTTNKLSPSKIIEIVLVDFFERTYRICSKIYSDRMGFETVFDFEEVISFFINDKEKTIEDQSEHISSKHSLLGNTYSTIYENVYAEFVNLIKRLDVCANYDMKYDDEELLMSVLAKNSITIDDLISNTKKKGESEDDEEEDNEIEESKPLANNEITYIFHDDINNFGYSFVRVLTYINSSLKTHTHSKCTEKERIIVHCLSTNGDEDVSRYERKMREADVFDKESYSQCIDNKEEYLKAISKDLNIEYINEKVLALNKLGVTRNPLNNMIMTIRLDYDNIIVGNPIQYFSASDLHRYLVIISCWSKLEKYPSLKKCILSKMTTDQCEVDNGGIMHMLEENFADHSYKEKLYKMFIDCAGNLYRYIDTFGTEYTIRLNVEELINFCKDVIDV